jgi:hypothetical protein
VKIAMITPALCLLAALCQAESVAAHDLGGHRGPTYEVTAPWAPSADAHTLQLTVLDAATKKSTPARFTVTIDGEAYVPDTLDDGGIRFVSIHTSKKQREVVLYARGNGSVRVPVPKDARRATVTVVKGLEYLPAVVEVDLVEGVTPAEVRITRWADPAKDGWLPAEEHLHYDRLDPQHDRDWLTMLAADDLAMGHFMVLKGGNLPGVWAEQYAYSPEGQADDGHHHIVPGEEYRDSLQGHINLLGMRNVILPIMSGTRDHRWNYPPLHDVLLEARAQGAVTGPAHGATLGRSTTGAVDAVLGAIDFFELANTHLYEPDLWYRLLNCGYVFPPAAGTDLPNFPFRDAWQPFLGETRMYVQMGECRDFAAWKTALRQGKTFITSGPMIRLTVDGAGPGSIVRLAPAGGAVEIEAELASPRPLDSFTLLHTGAPVPGSVTKSQNNGIHRWTIRKRLKVECSGWLAATGHGVSKDALREATNIEQRTMAHTAAIQVLVGDSPIRSRHDAAWLLEHIKHQVEVYRRQGRFETDTDREHLLELFGRAAARLKLQVN